jgi:glycosyltransferase involved in cell wall biosynthesis
MPQIIHAHVVLPAGWAAVQLGKRFGLPVVLTEHSSPFSMHLRSPLDRELVGETLAGVDHVMSVSPSLSAEIRDAGFRPKMTVVGNLVRTDFFQPGTTTPDIPDERPIILSVGILTEQKGIELMIRALRLLANRGVEAQLVVGGDGPLRSELEAQTETHGLRDRCTFTGLLTPAELRDWMRRATVFALPSLHETFGIVLGEAMACGVPVVATRCGGPEFVVTRAGGLLVDVGDVEGLAKALTSVLSGHHSFDPDLVRESVVSRFGPQAFGQAVAEVYAAICSR